MPKLPVDPEDEQREKLRQRFLVLGFTETEAARLVEHWADPLIVSWEMTKHEMSHHWASYIYGPGKPEKETA